MLLSWTNRFIIPDTGDETLLNELRVNLTSNEECNQKWNGKILNTHICVGNGDIGACQVTGFEICASDYD